MVQRLNSCVCQADGVNVDACQAERSRSLNVIEKGVFVVIFLLFTLHPSYIYAQADGPKPPRVHDYKNDSSYQDFNKLRFKIAKAQINLLKTEGALLVRLKTNANTINRLKASGNTDMAVQVQRETELGNKIIMESYKQAFTFCPVYFFFSNYSDSVKHKKLAGILLDSTLSENANIVCDKPFYLIADESTVYNSSLGFVPESQAEKAIETGSPSREAPIVIKNRYFIQLHKPFPYFQIKGTASNIIDEKSTTDRILINLNALYYQINKATKHSKEAKQLIRFRGKVVEINKAFEEFYAESKDYVLPPELKQFVY